MAQTNTCDICGETAVDTIVVRSNTTTTIEKDVCQKHLEEYKRIMRIFTGQEPQELVVDEVPATDSREVIKEILGFHPTEVIFDDLTEYDK